MSDLALLPQTAPTVTTLANPAPDWLLQARQALQGTPEGQAIYAKHQREGHDPGWLEDKLATFLLTLWGPGQAEQAQECGIYLAAERAQINQPVLVDPGTGRAIGVFKPEDFYVPEPVARESGSIVQRYPDLRPEIKSAIILHEYDKARDKELLEELGGQAPTELLKLEGDQRLQQVTVAGRKGLGDRVLATPPEDILRAIGGRLGRAFNQWVQVTGVQDGGTEIILSGTLTRNCIDPKAVNLQAGGYGSLVASMANEWASNLFGAILALVPPTKVLPEVMPEGLVLCPPAIRSSYPQAVLTPTPRLGVLTKRVELHSLRVENTRNFELSGQWTLEYTIACRVVVDHQELIAMELDLPREAEAF
jgi:hypothetical protein